VKTQPSSPTTQCLTDETVLIEQYLLGDPTAVGTIDGWITNAARSYRRRLGNRWDDAVQEARLETFRLLQDRRFRGESKLSTFLWRVVNHTCLDALRAAGRRHRLGASASDETLEALAGQVSDQSAAYEAADLVLRVLAEAPAHCRRLWSMIHGGLSYREMSRILGDSEGALRVRVLRCRRQAMEIRKRLHAAEPTSEDPIETKSLSRRHNSERRE